MFKVVTNKWFSNNSNHLFSNHLIHEQLFFKLYDFLFINLLEHVEQDKLSGSSKFFTYYTLLLCGHNLVLPYEY